MTNAKCISALALVTMWCAACLAQNDVKPAAATAVVGEKALPRYITSAEVSKMPACSATFTKRLSEFGGTFTTTEGKPFIIGDIRGEQWVWHFVVALREGRTYRFPDVFTNYLAATNYVTTQQIAAMPPCNATIAARSPCSSHFVTTDGKWFGIGDPGSGAQISQFIWSMKEGQTNKFPDVFLNYQTAPNYRTAKEIAEMAPRTGTLAGQFTDFCYFTTADGKGFFIGAGVSGPEVDHFLRTLEEDKTYQFPDVFVSYQKPKK